MNARMTIRNGWNPAHLLAALIMAAVGVFATLDAWRDIWKIALRDEEASHMLLVPVVVGWLLWARRGRLRQCRPRGLWIGPLIVAAGWGISMSGHFYDIQAFWHGGAIVVAVGCMLSVLGIDVLRQFMPAVVALAFLVPVPGLVRQEIAIPLQQATATVTQNLLEVMGVPVVRSGAMLTLNGVDIGIAEACNGLRMVFALVLVSYAFAFGTPLRNFVRILIVAASPLSAILCNVVRLIPTVWLYGYQGEQIGKWFHDYSGWAMLGVAFLLLMGIIQILKWALVPVVPYTLAQD